MAEHVPSESRLRHLRDVVAVQRACGTGQPNHIEWALDEIERLRAENADLRTMVDLSEVVADNEGSDGSTCMKVIGNHDREPELQPDAMTYYVEDDPFDRFPWVVSLYTASMRPEQGGRRAFITTPNGVRPDGTMHTYWGVAHELWEPIAVIIAKAVNAEAHARFGTPNPSSVYADEWRASASLPSTNGTPS